VAPAEHTQLASSDRDGDTAWAAHAGVVVGIILGVLFSALFVLWAVFKTRDYLRESRARALVRQRTEELRRRRRSRSTSSWEPEPFLPYSGDQDQDQDRISPFRVAAWDDLGLGLDLEMGKGKGATSSPPRLPPVVVQLKSTAASDPYAVSVFVLCCVLLVLML
jgi:hypothetical protein